MLAHYLVDRGHSRNAAIGGRRRFESNSEGFPPRSKAYGQCRFRPFIEKRTEKSSVSAIQDIRDAGVAKTRQLRGVDPALRGAPGMEGLGHGAVLNRHQAGRLRSRDAKSVLGLMGVQTEDLRGGRSGDENSSRA